MAGLHLHLSVISTGTFNDTTSHGLRWRQLGFQSCDPRTDLRTGILAPAAQEMGFNISKHFLLCLRGDEHPRGRTGACVISVGKARLDCLVHMAERPAKKWIKSLKQWSGMIQSATFGSCTFRDSWWCHFLFWGCQVWGQTCRSHPA